MVNFLTKSLLPLLVLLCAVQGVMGQKVPVNGYIYDAEGEPLIGASVLELSQKVLVQTNNYGFFSVPVRPGKTVFRVTYPGSEPDTISLNLTRDTTISVYLRNLQLSGVDIVASSADEPYEPEKTTLLIGQAKKIPSLAGEVDILKALSFTPGVNNGSEGQSGLFVRGGSQDQNLILLDNAPVYNPNHLFGFLSVFNPDALKNVDLYKGGFPARYGGRLSSVLDIQMKEGSRTQTKGDIGIGLISSRFLLEKPAFRRKGSVLIAARSAYLGVLLFPRRLSYNSGSVSDYTGYSMYDINVKVNRAISPRQHVYLSFYSGQDRLLVLADRESRVTLRWGNNTGTFRHTYQLSDKLYWKNIVYFSRFGSAFDYSFNDKTTNTRLNSYSGLFDAGVKSEMDYFLNEKHTVKTGIEYVYHAFFPVSSRVSVAENGVVDVERTLRQTTAANELSIFAEDKWQPSRRLSLDYGLRLNYYKEQKAFYFLQPGLMFHWRLQPQFSVHVGFNYSYQNIHIASNSNLGLPNDVWLPATNRLLPGRALQIAGGVGGNLPDWRSKWSVEVFMKKMTHQIDYREGVNPLLNTATNWEDLITTGGRGQSQGVECSFSKSSGRWTGLFAYSYSVTTRQFADINNGNAYRFNYDYPHLLNATFNYDNQKKWNFSGSFVYRSGQPYSFPEFAMESPGGGSPLFFYTARNNIRLPDYIRVDVAAAKRVTTRNGREATWTYSIYNLLNRKNILYAQVGSFITDYVDQKPVYRPKLELKPFLPILPSVSYSIKF
jgi:hypothetical protein